VSHVAVLAGPDDAVELLRAPVETKHCTYLFHRSEGWGVKGLLIGEGTRASCEPPFGTPGDFHKMTLTGAV